MFLSRSEHLASKGGTWPCTVYNVFAGGQEASYTTSRAAQRLTRAVVKASIRM